MPRAPRLLATVATIAAWPALAAAPVEDAAPPAGDAYHAQPENVIVTAPLRHDRQDMLSGVAVLDGTALTRALRPTIGETLQRTPGVSATSFGPNASRPVLRGLQGERVRVLTDGIGAIDVSNTSVDHAVAVDPLTAERIEVLRGPESLLYGSSAIGGVVNVIDRRIPRAIPDEPVHVMAIGTYGSAADERSVGGAIDAPVAGPLVLHADGSYTRTNDLRIGGSVLSANARAQALASSRLPVADQVDADGAPVDFAGNAALRDRLPNSAARTWTAAIGGSIVTDTGHMGVAYSRYDSRYGIPVRFATQPGREQEAPVLDIRQERVDGRAEIDTGGDLLKQIRVRLGHATYRHFELEEDGSIGTAFYNQGSEGRIELVQADRGVWSGVVGGQFFLRDFNVVGDEAFLPRNETEQFGVFTVQHLDWGRLKAEGGLRYERSSLRGQPLEDQPQFFDGTRTFDAVSGSIGGSYEVVPGWRLGTNVSRTVRAPAAEELFANGPHAGTEAFEVGDPAFRTERSTGVEAVLRGAGRGYTLEASVYHNWFARYIYEAATGAVEDGLPVFQSGQADARFYGFEVQSTVTLATIGTTRVVADALADYVHATIRQVGPAPRIPPLRALGGLGAESRFVDGRVEVEWTDRQDRTSALETATAGFTMVNAALTIRPWGTDRPVSLIVSANNIFDVDARRHASFLKDFAPLAGRDVRVSARVNF